MFDDLKKTLASLYDVHYKKFMVFSFLVLFASLGLLGFYYVSHGEFFAKGVSLKGGITFTVQLDSPIVLSEIESGLASSFPQADINVREISTSGRASALIIEATDLSIDDLKFVLPTLGVPLPDGSFSAESMGSSLGQRFFAQTMKAVVLAFVMMAIVVFFTFRSLVPSLFIILSAVSNILCTMAVLNLLGMKLSSAGIAALLMLIGYSVDTNILLTTKVLKRRTEGGTILSRTLGALRTGLTMTFTALTSSIVGLILFQSEAVRQIMIIVTIGLLFDLIFTWFQNSGILRLYMERKYGQN